MLSFTDKTGEEKKGIVRLKSPNGQNGEREVVNCPLEELKRTKRRKGSGQLSVRRAQTYKMEKEKRSIVR
ncbi:hypothetical protein [Gracilibacillus salinarum]|uniref:Uncharacterized protein n=1 Tax=Gracilibacillus salinarum TaxID=2932255 RepID=A0ABY4GRF6_9BACI|nr:hypothetical protein [Gracilibacillus salinarum]UOQ86952.1 hypothetical protein MUN87_08755 [Gracilibacillus salinarum]